MRIALAVVFLAFLMSVAAFPQGPQAFDVVIFDPSLVQDVSTFEQPLAYPKGIAYVLVNGRVAVDAGQVTGLRAGRCTSTPALTADSIIGVLRDCARVTSNRK
jgi:hypothetical protein